MSQSIKAGNGLSSNEPSRCHRLLLSAHHLNNHPAECIFSDLLPFPAPWEEDLLPSDDRDTEKPGREDDFWCPGTVKIGKLVGVWRL